MGLPLVIVDRGGLVHRGDADGCEAARTAPKRVPVTPAQALTYQLDGCVPCFKDSYNQAIGRIVR